MERNCLGHGAVVGEHLGADVSLGRLGQVVLHQEVLQVGGQAGKLVQKSQVVGGDGSVLLLVFRYVRKDSGSHPVQLDDEVLQRLLVKLEVLHNEVVG